MRVAHLCFLPLPPDHPDHGRLMAHPGRWVLNLAQAQRQYTTVRPELITVVPGARRDFETDLEGVPARYLAVPARGRALRLFAPDRLVLRDALRRSGPDLVHAHGTEQAYALAAQASGRPYAITLQGLHLAINRVIRPPWHGRERVVALLERRCLARARHVVAKSGYIADQVRDRFPHLVLHEIPNTYDPRILDVREERHPRRLVFAGLIAPRKGLDVLRRAIERMDATMPELELDVVGNIASGASAYERDELAALRSRLGPRLILSGLQTNLDTARRIAGAAILVAPSREEMFGNQIVEALLVGTHAVVTEGTAMAENVRAYGNGTVVPQEDPRALADALLALLRNGVPAGCAEKARRHVQDALAPAAIASRHETLYRTILKEAGC